jgi:hypothetical protein
MDRRARTQQSRERRREGAMAQETVEKRVSALEKTVRNQVTSRDLEALQTALSAQILQLGAEMRVGFSALRDEIRGGDEQTRRVLREEIRGGGEETRRVLREEIRGGDEQTRGLVEERTAELLAVIAAGHEEIRRHARMLHDEVIGRIKAISTG